MSLTFGNLILGLPWGVIFAKVTFMYLSNALLKVQ